MIFAIGLALIAQSAAPAIAEASPGRNSIAVSVTATVRVLKPAIVRADGTLGSETDATSVAPQRDRDSSGTYWIEFS